jgi:D-3-phosphoglycerate dehydrogenase / 2-oxoglutarate reductase
MKKVLVTDDVHTLLIEGLEKMGFVCDYQPDITNAQAHDVIGDYAGLIINSKIFVDKAMIDAAPHLRFVGRVGSGMEIVDIPYATERGVAVLSSPEGNRNAVAEHALGMLLALANNLNRSNAEVKNFQWFREKNRGFELMGKTIGIVGYGHTGSAFARKLLGFGLRILYYDKYLLMDNGQWIMDNELPVGSRQNAIGRDRAVGNMHYTDEGLKNGIWVDENWHLSAIERVDIETLQKESDIISFHLPLTAEVTHMANADFFKACHKNIVLINTSRGKVVHTGDFIAALESGKVEGACLDVFENEKTATYTEGERLMYQKLFSFENVIVSPHIAGWTHQSKARLAAVLLEKIEKALGLDSI